MCDLVILGGISLIGSFGFHSQQFLTWCKLLFYHQKCNFYKMLGLISTVRSTPGYLVDKLFISQRLAGQKGKNTKSSDYSRKPGIVSESRLNSVCLSQN